MEREKRGYFHLSGFLLFCPSTLFGVMMAGWDSLKVIWIKEYKANNEMDVLCVVFRIPIQRQGKQQSEQIVQKKKSEKSSEFQNLIQFSFLLSCFACNQNFLCVLKTGIYFFPLIYFLWNIYFILACELDDSKISHHVLSFLLGKVPWAFVVVLRFWRTKWNKTRHDKKSVKKEADLK